MLTLTSPLVEIWRFLLAFEHADRTILVALHVLELRIRIPALANRWRTEANALTRLCVLLVDVLVLECACFLFHIPDETSWARKRLSVAFNIAHDELLLAKRMRMSYRHVFFCSHVGGNCTTRILASQTAAIGVNKLVCTDAVMSTQRVHACLSSIINTFQSNNAFVLIILIERTK